MVSNLILQHRRYSLILWIFFINFHKQWRTLKIALLGGWIFPVNFCCCWILSLEVFQVLKLPSLVECFSLFLLHFCFVIIAAMNFYSVLLGFEDGGRGGGFLLWKQHVLASKGLCIGSCHCQFITAMWIANNHRILCDCP